MTRKQSILSQVISRSAKLLSEDPRIPAENRQAFADTAESVMHGQWSMLFGGERVRVYASKSSRASQDQRRQRIVAALKAGETHQAIAERESVTLRWVRKLAQSLKAERLGP